MKRDILIAFAFILAILLALDVLVTASAESIGAIKIPSINCTFDLVWTAKEKDEHQHYALLYKRQGCQHVGNHYGSMSPSGGQWKLENVKIGDKAYLEYVTGNGVALEQHSYKYVCYAVMICDVREMVLYHNGREIVFDDTDLVCVTCVGSDSTRNYVAVFERVE